MSENDIRMDWLGALKHMHDNDELISDKIGWGFTTQDLLVLGTLHMLNKYRSTIEYLLEDCNFHTECSLLDKCDYVNYMKEILKS